MRNRRGCERESNTHTLESETDTETGQDLVADEFRVGGVRVDRGEQTEAGGGERRSREDPGVVSARSGRSTATDEDGDTGWRQ